MFSTSSQLLARAAGYWVLASMASALMFGVAAQADENKTASRTAEDAIRAAVESYVDAYNRGDAKAVASHWSESAEWISPSGQRFQGRQAIQDEMQSLFADRQEVRIEVINPSIRLISPEVAMEEGIVRVIRPAELPSDSTYLAIHVKQDGRWKLDSVRETELPDVPAASPHLEDLAWLVGEWIDQSSEATVESNVVWTKNKTFLSYSFKVSVPGMDDLEGTQVIGWDPAAGTIRSWMFDSDGGLGEGVWSKRGDGWIVKFSQVLPDGRKASATNMYTLLDANTFTWKSVGRKLGSEFLPNTAEVTVVRKTTNPPVAEAPKAAAKLQKARVTK